MAARARYVVTTALLAAVTVGTQVGVGVVTPTELDAFPMPPSQGFGLNRDFGFVGDYSYVKARGYATSGSRGANSFVFHRYGGLAGKSINIWPRFATQIPPAPFGNGDACFHAHLAYGVWTEKLVWRRDGGGDADGGRIGFRGPGPLVATTEFKRVGGGSMSGVRTPQGTCELRTQNSLVALDPSFGWGSDFTSFNVPLRSNITAVIVGATAPTHGWGTCVQGYPFCFEPIWMNIWTLPT